MPLPGKHYCKKHQGNTSHYDPANCDLCQLLLRLKQEEAHTNTYIRLLHEMQQDRDELARRLAIYENPTNPPKGD